MQFTHALAPLRVTAVGGLLLLAGLALPTTAFGQGSAGVGPGVAAPAAAPVSEVLGLQITAPQAPPAAVVPGAPAAPPAAAGPPPVIAEVAGLQVQQQPQPGAVLPPAAPDIADVAGRIVTAGQDEVLGQRTSAGLPAAGQRGGPGLDMARVLPKAGTGPLDGDGLWLPQLLALTGLAVGGLGLLWPVLRRRARRAEEP